MKKSMLAHSVSCAAFLASMPYQLNAQQDDAMETVVVTGVVMSDASTVTADPKRLRQPLPAHDGGEYLKSIPGFSIVRKGGNGGDPVFRGMAASRLTIVNDDGLVLGGCGSRMDPPTAYITPQNYDRLVIIKGPQTVRYLPANATVRFERDHDAVQDIGNHGQVDMTVASFGKRELTIDTKSVASQGYARVMASKGTSDDYKDGQGNAINSQYDRQSFTTEAAYTGETHTLIASYTQSMGEAAYADRSMDGVRFDRRQWQLRWLTSLPIDIENRLDVSVQRADVDHVMDNYSLRDFVPSMMSMEPAVMNPTRLTNSARAELSLTVNEDLVTRLGIDASENTHENRMTMKQYSMPYQSLPLVEDGYFKQMGMFAETDWQLAPQWFWFNGIRNDQWQADDERNMLMLSMMNMVMNPTANDHREQSLTSGFSRVEYREDGVQAYAGIGHSERFPDYWELIGKARSSETSMSSFYTAPEKTTQLDVGLITSGDKYRLSMSAYYGKINDYILLQVVNPMLPEQLRNIDASIWGAEVGGEWKATDKLALRLSMAASRGSNDTDRTTLPQIAPYEVRFSGDYTLDAWTLGGMYRLVAAQERVVPGQGTIVSLDTTPTAGFGVLSLNAERKWDQWRLNVGIDNALDRQYQEFLSRSSSVVPGYSVVGRVPEPGRSIWAGVNYSF